MIFFLCHISMGVWWGVGGVLLENGYKEREDK